MRCSVMDGLKSVLRFAFRHGVVNITLPLLLVHELPEVRGCYCLLGRGPQSVPGVTQTRSRWT